MRIGRYKITRRGYIVFGGLGLVLLGLLIWLLSQWMPSGANQSDLSTNQTNETNQSASEQSGNTGANPSSQGNQTTSPVETLSEDAIDRITQAISATVYFKPDAYDLDDSYYDALKEIVETSVRFKNVTVIVEGHYNSKPGDVQTPQREALSQNRADVVVAYLVSQGVDPARIETVNMGAKQPVNQDDSWQEIEKNRRVLVKFKALKP